MALTALNLSKWNGIYLHEIINKTVIIIFYYNAMIIYIINVKLSTSVNKIVIK